MLPEQDGWDVIEAVRSNPETRDLPIVVMSAKIGLIGTGHHGVQGYVSKPLAAMLAGDVPLASQRSKASGAITSTCPPMRAWSVPQYSVQRSSNVPACVGVKAMVV